MRLGTYILQRVQCVVHHVLPFRRPGHDAKRDHTDRESMEHGVRIHCERDHGA